MSLTEEYEENSLRFLKKYPLDSGAYEWAPDSTNKIFDQGIANKYFGTRRDDGVMNWQYDADARRFKLVRGSDHSCVQLVAAGQHDEGPSMNAYYLPWSPQRVTSARLPRGDVKYFFTAALSGCSVFVRGDAREPTVYHAGVAMTAKHESKFLWEACMRKLGKNHPTPRYYGINRYDYVKTGTGKRKGLKREFSDDDLEGLSLDYLYPYYTAVSFVSSRGCVVGIKDDNDRWDFYLQQRNQYEVFQVVTGDKRTYWTPVSLRRFYPTGAKHVQLIPQVKLHKLGY